MRIFVDVSHPAHVHFFRHIIRELRRRGHTVYIASRAKEMTEALLSSYGLEFKRFSVAATSIPYQVLELMVHWWKVLRFLRKKRVDLAISISGLFTSLPGRMARVFNVMETDTEDAGLSNRISLKFADVVVTPSAYLMDYGPNHIKYDGYHELAYMHPSRFSPDSSALSRYGLSKDSRFWVVRSVEWSALHDRAEQGFSAQGLVRLVDFLRERGTVIVSSEGGDVPNGALPVADPADMHHLLYYASGYVGESPTMAMEAAICGTPSLLVSSRARKLGYIVEMEERYGLIKVFNSEDELWTEISFLNEPARDQRKRRDAMLSEKVDVVDWFVDAIENHFWMRGR